MGAHVAASVAGGLSWPPFIARDNHRVDVDRQSRWSLVAYLAPRLLDAPGEQFMCLLFGDDGLLRAEHFDQGGLSFVAAERTALMRAAVRHDARYVVVAHNHPSGDPQPSRADVDATRTLHTMFGALGATLYDHMILADRACFSFRAAGLI